MAAGVLAEDHAIRRNTDRSGCHDLIGQRVREHSMLVDACLMREGIAADDGLVRRRRKADDLRQLLAYREELIELEVVVDGELIAADAQRGSDFFQSRIACTLTDAVDGAL